MRRWQVVREPTVPILLLACVVHAVRRNLFDLLLFAGTAALIVADSWRATPGRVASAPPGANNGSPAWAAWLAVIAFAMLAGPLPQSGGAVQVVLVAVGLAALAVVVVGRGPAAGTRHPSLRGWPVWAALGALACVWELTSFAIQQDDPAVDNAHPTASDLIGPLLGSWPGRMVFLALWAAAGLWLLRRLSAAPRQTAGRPPTAGIAGGDADADADRGAGVDRPEQAAGGAEAAR